MELTNQGMGLTSPTPTVRVMTDRPLMEEDELEEVGHRVSGSGGRATAERWVRLRGRGYS